MSNILELLKNTKVEWKKLGELGVFHGGLVGKRKNDFEKGNKKFITYKNVYNNPSTNLDIKDMVRIYEREKQRKVEYGDVIFTGSSETLEEVGLSSVITEEVYEDIYLNSFCFCLRLYDKNLLLPDFLKHLFRSKSLRTHIKKTASGVTRYNVSKKLMKEISIPIPPLELQKEIVRILDTFSSLKAELQAELQAELILRKKQYEHYLNMLLSEKYLSECIEKMEGDKRKLSFYELREVFSIKNGYTPSKSKKEYWKEGEIPWFRMEDIRKNGNILNDSILHVSKSAIKTELFNANSIIVATSATIGEHALITIDFLANQRFTCFTLKDEFLNDINIKYVYYYFYLIDEWCKKNTKLGNFQSVDIDKLLMQKIVLPDISIQEKIVKVLDKFQELIEQAKGALPKEIELRQKQYEYYRDTLLTFNEKYAERENI